MGLPTGNRASRIRSNVSYRQKLKKKWDRHCKYQSDDDLPTNLSVEGQTFALENYSESSENWQRLLDEGVVVDGDGWAFAVVCKGAIKKFYDNLPSNFVGYINKDHISAIGLGKFTKKDLRLVELGNDRYALDVNVKLDDELFAVKDLKREMNRKALSVEMFVNADEYATAESVTGDEKQGKWLIPLIDELKIEGYAVCDNPKNANSYDEGLLEKASNTNLTEETTVKKKFMNGEQVDPETEAIDEAVVEQNTDAEESVETEATEVKASGADGPENAPAETADVEEEADKADATEEVAEEATEETTEEATEETTEEAEDETTDTEDGDADDEGDKLSAVEDTIKSLKAEVDKLRAEKADLEAKLSAKTTEKENFEARLSNMLSLASDSEPTNGEGGETTPENSKSSDIEDIYSNAFKELE